MTSTESKKVSLEQISSLREITGAGILLCKSLAATIVIKKKRNIRKV